MTLNKLSSEQIRFIKFALVGLSGTVVDFAIFNLCSIDLGLPTIVSSAISFIIAVFNNFIWNRLWTYPESRKFKLSEQFGKFALVSVAGLVIRTLIFLWIENPLILFSKNYLSAIPIDPEVIGHNITLASVIVIVLFWNYFINKMWTYKDIKEG